MHRRTDKHFGFLIAVLVAFQIGWLLPGTALAAKTYHVGILVFGSNRQEPLNGFQDEMKKHAQEEGYDVAYDIKDAGGDRKLLTDLARQIVAARPDVAIAGGGVEADALKEATAGTAIPVIFLGVSAAVERGLAAEMRRPGGNLTGIETNDALLTGKRLWYISKILPKAKRVRIFHIPSIGASVESVKVAREAADTLGLELTVVEVADKEGVIKAAKEITPENTDVVLISPLAPLDAVQAEALLPLSLEKKIPVMGYNEGSVNKGAFATYAGSRYEMGRQAVTQVHKVLLGQSPAEMAIETPEKIEFILNRWMVNRLGLKLPKGAWKMADKIVDIEF